MTKTPPTVSLADVLAAVRDRRDNGGGSASYQQACNHLIEAVQLLRPTHTPAPDTRLPDYDWCFGEHGDFDASKVISRHTTIGGYPNTHGIANTAFAAGKSLTPHPAVEVTEKRAREVLAKACEFAGLRASAQLLRMGNYPAVGSEPAIRAMLAFAASASTTENGV